MNAKLYDWIIKIFVVLYATMCVVAVASTENYIKTDDIDMDKISCGKNTKQSVLYWVNQTKKSSDATCPSEIEVSDSVIVDCGTLDKILNEKFYIPKGENVASGLFMPVAMLKYYDTQGVEFYRVYSLMNSEVRVYKGNKLEKTMLVYDANKLQQIFESL